MTELLDAYVDKIANLISANGFEISANGTITLGNNDYGIKANVLLRLPSANEKLSIAATALISFNDINILDIGIWLKDDMLYASVNGLQIVANLAETDKNVATASETSIADKLKPLYGYNTYLDIVLDTIQNMIGADTLNVNELVKGLTFDNEKSTLAAQLDGNQFGISTFDLGLAHSEKGLSATIQNLTMNGRVTLNLAASVAESSEQVDVQNKDWRTDIIVKLDGDNTLYGRLDILNNVYEFKLVNTASQTTEENAFYISYANGELKVKKSDDVRVIGNIDAIKELVEEIDKIVKAFAGGTTQQQTEENTAVDTELIKKIVQSLSISTASDNETVVVDLKLLEMPVSIELADRNGPKIVGVSITINISKEKKTFVAMPNLNEDVAYGEFGDTSEYIAIDKVLNDFKGYIDNLITTNSWRFDFHDDVEITIKDKQQENVYTTYAITGGDGDDRSYFEFFYNRNHPEDLTIKAKLTLKQNSGDSEWTPLCTLDLLYADGRIYVTYNNTLKLTIAVSSIKECSEAWEDLQTAIPQIADLIASFEKLVEGAEDNLANLDYTTILQKVSYTEEQVEGSTSLKKFEIGINGGLLLGSLGNITLIASNEFDTLTLDTLTLSYDNVSVKLGRISVTADTDISEKATGEARTPSDYAQLSADVKSYFDNSGDKSNHISFDSLQHLMQAVADTALKETFAIDGVITATLDLSSMNLSWVANATVPILANIRVDLERATKEGEDDKVFIAVLLTRYNTQAKVLTNYQGVYDDKGGQSYLTYDSTQRYSTDANGKTTKDENGDQKGWFTVSRYQYSWEDSNETWEEMEVYDYCNTCGKIAEDGCYPICTYDGCGKTGDDTYQCKVDWCSECGAPKSEQCNVDWCSKHNCQWGTGNCNGRWHSSNKDKAHSGQYIPAHAEYVKEHSITTKTRIVTKNPEGKTVEKAVMPSKSSHYWEGGTTEFTSGIVTHEGTNKEISRLEFELYEMLHLGTLKPSSLGLIKINLEDIIVNSIHPDSGDSGTNTSIENLLKNLQNIFLNYEYVEPTTEENGTVQDAYFRIKANLKALNDQFGVLDVSIGHTFEDAANLKGLNLTYVKGSWGLASVVNLSFNLTLQQDTTDYAGDATYFVKNGTVWNSLDHKPQTAQPSN